jgi:hypothetical protein
LIFVNSKPLTPEELRKNKHQQKEKKIANKGE